MTLLNAVLGQQGQLFNQPLIRSKMSWQRLILLKSELY